MVTPHIWFGYISIYNIHGTIILDMFQVLFLSINKLSKSVDHFMFVKIILLLLITFRNELHAFVNKLKLSCEPRHILGFVLGQGSFNSWIHFSISVHGVNTLQCISSIILRILGLVTFHLSHYHTFLELALTKNNGVQA